MSSSVGIAVSSTKLAVHIRPEGVSFNVSNDLSGFKQLVEKISDDPRSQVLLEATGGYECAALSALYFVSNSCGGTALFSQVDSKKIAALVGVAPFNQDSGKHSGKRTIWGGRSRGRRALYMACWIVIRHNKDFKQWLRACGY